MRWCAGANISDTLVFDTTTAHWVYMLWAPFAYYRGVWLLGQHAYSVGTTAADDELVSALLFLVLDIALYWVILLYLDEVRRGRRTIDGCVARRATLATQVLPSQYGVAKRPLFCIEDACVALRKRSARSTPPVSAAAVGTTPAEFSDSDVARAWRDPGCGVRCVC